MTKSDRTVLLYNFSSIIMYEYIYVLYSFSRFEKYKFSRTFEENLDRLPVILFTIIYSI